MWIHLDYTNSDGGYAVFEVIPSHEAKVLDKGRWFLIHIDEEDFCFCLDAGWEIEDSFCEF